MIEQPYEEGGLGAFVPKRRIENPKTENDVRIDMQMELINRTTKPKPGESFADARTTRAMEWSTADDSKEAKEFSEIFDELLRKYPDIVKTWQEDGEGLLAEVGERMFKGDHREAA